MDRNTDERIYELLAALKQARVQIKATLRRAESAEATINGMVSALRDVMPAGFCGDNPVWACGKIADRLDELTGEIKYLNEHQESRERDFTELQDLISSAVSAWNDWEEPCPFDAEMMALDVWLAENVSRTYPSVEAG